MKLRYIPTLLTLLMVLCFTFSADAQRRPAQKPATPPKKADAQNIGDAASKVKVDTTKNGGAGNNPQQNGGSLSEEIVITTAYKPVLADAVKLRRNPDMEDKAPFKAPLTYTPIDKRLERNTDIKQLNAMRMPAEVDSIPTNNFVRVGVGSLKTTFAEGYFGNGKDEALQVAGYFKHMGQRGTAFEKQNTINNQIGVFGKSIGPVNSLSGRIDFSNRSNYFYGFNPYDPPPANVFYPSHQYFNTISAEGELAKNYRDVENDFTYAVKLQGYGFADRYKARENNVAISGFLNQTVKQFYAGASASLDLTTQKDEQYSINNSIARVNPYIKFQGTNYKIDAGVTLATEFGFSSRFFIFPAAKAELQVIPKYARLFVEAKGDINKSTLRNFYAINPFLGQNIGIRNSVDELDISAGLKGTLAPGLNFKATIYRNNVKNMPLMVSNFNIAAGYNKFAVRYDDGTARVSGFTGEVDYKATEDVNIFGSAEFVDYQLASETTAWNLPKFKLKGGASIRINDKVIVNGTLLYRGQTFDPYVSSSMLTAGATRSSIDAFADLSGGVEYKVTKKITIFGQVNNILNANSQNWLYYPNYGFNIFGGASYSF
ncbi:hypothetical protein ACFQZS_08185 [Mucilaginibacter calamicampi]|uniref:TonB dependent receptor n=1 Tax=Mucilaginibacter calamicampi TaxID=1302352 RepID=A0ABW2YW84_9SPHI